MLKFLVEPSTGDRGALEQGSAEVESAVAQGLAETESGLAKAEDELASLRQMVDAMPVKVMTVDPNDLNINYVNQTSVDTLKGLEHPPPVTADQLIGQCIDIFDKNPEHQRQILRDPANLPYPAHYLPTRRKLNLAPEIRTGCA